MVVVEVAAESSSQLELLMETELMMSPLVLVVMRVVLGLRHQTETILILMG
jgi:hypothetical protein